VLTGLLGGTVALLLSTIIVGEVIAMMLSHDYAGAVGWDPVSVIQQNPNRIYVLAVPLGIFALGFWAAYRLVMRVRSQ